jgi:hypothetical protein
MGWTIEDADRVNELYESTAPFSFGRELNDQKMRVEYAKAPTNVGEVRPLPLKLRLDVARNLDALITKAGG